MDNSRNIIFAFLGNEEEIVLRPRHRYDYGQILQIIGTLPPGCHAEFSNDGITSSEPYPIVDDRVSIPDDYFQHGDLLKIYISKTTETYRVTLYEICIPLIERPAISDSQS